MVPQEYEFKQMVGRVFLYEGCQFLLYETSQGKHRTILKSNSKYIMNIKSKNEQRPFLIQFTRGSILTLERSLNLQADNDNV